MLKISPRAVLVLLVLLAQIPGLSARAEITVLSSEIHLEARVGLSGVLDNPMDLDSQTTGLNSLAAQVLASEEDLGCLREVEASQSAVWHSATRGNVNVYARALSRAVSAPGTPANMSLDSRGWRYRFQATADDSIIVDTDVSRSGSLRADVSLSRPPLDPIVFGPPNGTGSVEFDVFSGNTYTLHITPTGVNSGGTCSGTQTGQDEEYTGSFSWRFASDLPPAAAYTLTTWNPDDVFIGTDLATFDASVGITGYTIESFEDPNLLSGVTVQGGATSATNVIDPARLRSDFPDALWDFATALELNVDASLNPGDIVFTLPAGVRSFGVGIGDVESNVEFLVNGQSFGTVSGLPSFKNTGNVANQPRQIYIRIDANDGFPDISEVRLRQIGSTGSGDLIYFDRLALDGWTPQASVPSLSPLGIVLMSSLLCIAGLMRVATTRRRLN